MMMRLYLASVWGHDEVSLNGMFAEESVSLVAEARLHLVISIQTFQCCPGDVNLPVGGGANNHTLTYPLYMWLAPAKKWREVSSIGGC